MTINLTECPSCGSRKLRAVRRNLKRSYKGKAYIVPAVEFYECPACGEHLYDRDAMQKIQAHSPAYARGRSSVISR